LKSSNNLVLQSRVRRSAAQWRDIIRQYEQSGQTQAVFCDEQSLALSTFSRWHQRLANSTDTLCNESHFVELSAHEELSGTSSSALWDVELQLGTDVVLRLRHRC